jgi:5'-nucleotidase
MSPGVLVTAAARSVDAARDDVDRAAVVRGVAGDNPGHQGDVIVSGGDSPPEALNVNVPDVPLARLRGIRYARLAQVGAVQVSIMGEGDEQLELTVSAPRHPEQPDSDSAALAAGYASVTAIQALCEAPADVVPWLPAPASPGPGRPGSGPGGDGGQPR